MSARSNAPKVSARPGARAPGLHLVHKPVGATSFSVVQSFRQDFGKLPVCHGGTLDPFAEGLLLLLVGQATRLMELLHAAPKRYTAVVRWGEETDNGDPTGKVVRRGDRASLSELKLSQALEPFLGWQDQVPPSTSAKKVGGEPAYMKVHRGEQVTLPPSRVYLQRAEWISHRLPEESTLRLCCGKGYYVRSLARDLGRALGCFARLESLHRTAIGPWVDPGPGQSAWVFGADLLPWLPWRALEPNERVALQSGQAIAVGEVRAAGWQMPEGFAQPTQPVRAISDGKLVAMLDLRKDRLHPIANLRGGL